MLCPKCGEEKSIMLRKVSLGESDMRIRRCKICGHVYHTAEIITGSFCAPKNSKTPKSTTLAREAETVVNDANAVDGGKRHF